MLTIVGQVLNERYEILEKIGEGGMAVAYRGRDRLLTRTVAIKIMRPELATDAGFLGRFRREARAAAGIVHEHIAAVYDTGSDGSYHYIVMEYVAGESLRDRLRREGPLPLEETLRIAEETAEALEAAHTAGVVHRDIKPHNILLGREGQVKVTDFGIARAASAPGAGDTSAVVGTVNYISPEQARGERVGPQGDIYSLGATLFEMLTGKPPFNGGDRLAVLHKHVYDRAPRPSESRPGLPAEVDSVVTHCLEKDLTRRFASAREVRSYLAACPRQEEAGASFLRRPRGSGKGAISAAGYWMRQRALLLGIAGVVLAGTAGGIAFYASGVGRVKTVPVPDVEGMTGLAAREVLVSAGLGYREVGTRPSEDMAKGAVLSQDPPAGRPALPDSVVKVVLSDGTSHVVVPDVTQMSVAQAQRNLEAAGLKSGIIREGYSPTVPAGYVASTLPTAGARVVPETTVDIVLSRGAEPPISVGSPDGVGQGEAGRDETLAFVVPADVGKQGLVAVTIELSDDSGRRRIYQGSHRAGERVPAQRIHITSATTARIYVDGKLQAERQYLP